MSEANKKIRDLERALRRERANVARATTERDRALSQVEELRRDNDHQRERRNAARDAVAKGQSARRSVEKECDQLKAQINGMKQRIELLELQLHMAEVALEAAEDTTVWHAAATLAPPGCPLLVRRSDGEVVEAIRPEYVRDRNPETPMGYFLLGDCKSEIHDPVEWAHR